MYEHSHYKRLTHLVDDAIAQRNLKPDSIKDMKIDDLLSHDELTGIDESVVVLVAAEKGFQYLECDYGTDCNTHNQPKIRANGAWVDMPPVLQDVLAQYRNQKTVTLCPVCEKQYYKIYEQQRDRLKEYRIAVENRIRMS
jgi:hypothetical protein